MIYFLQSTDGGAIKISLTIRELPSDCHLAELYGISYNLEMSTGPESKDVFLLDDGIKTPPLSVGARREAGALLRLIQDGVSIGMPRSRPMPSIGRGCHELRVRDGEHNWRIIYRIEADIILVVLIFAKTTRATPKPMIDLARRRLRDFDAQ